MKAVDLEQALVRLKLRLGITDGEQDEVLMLMLADAAQAVALYCSRCACPAPLEYVVRQMAVNACERDNGGNVSSIKRGDTQITYGAAITADDMTSELQAACQKFRRFRVL